MTLTSTELANRVNTISSVFLSILNSPGAFQQLGNDKQQQLITGINKSYGQAMSFQHEFFTTMRAQNKGRSVITQQHADVTVGSADALFAKSVECKSITKPEKGAVNKEIRKAIEQLGGQTNHNPRSEDIRIVDILIDQTSYNPWPMPGGNYGNPRPIVSLDDLKTKSINEIKQIITSNSPGATEIRNWLNGTNTGNAKGFSHARNVFQETQTLSNNPVQTKPHPNSSRPLFADTNNQIHKIRCLSIKIRYKAPYIVSEARSPSVLSSVSEMTFQIYKKPSTLIIELAKRKMVYFDLVSQSVNTEREWA